jgi:hypothetical protein
MELGQGPNWVCSAKKIRFSRALNQVSQVNSQPESIVICFSQEKLNPWPDKCILHHDNVSYQKHIRDCYVWLKK